MKRWNRWGSDEIDSNLPPYAKKYLVDTIGPTQPGPTADYIEVLQRVSKSRLPDHIMISKEASLRLGRGYFGHGTGQLGYGNGRFFRGVRYGRGPCGAGLERWYRWNYRIGR